jgi:membrane protease YdiL (CAAX protease family)
MKPAIFSRATKETDKKPSNPSKTLGRPAWVVFVTFIIFLVSQVLMAPLVVIIGKTIFAPHASLDLENSAAAQFFFILAAEFTAAWLAIKIVRRRGLPLSAIGLGRRPVLGDLWRAALGVGAIYLLLIIAGIFINLFAPDITNEQQNIGFNNINTHADNIFAFVSLVLLPPIGEEILTRGYLFSGLRMTWRFWPAALVTSLFFGAAHLEFGNGGPLVWAAAIDTCLLSFVLCYLRERSGALYAGMMVHMLNNFVAFGIHFK